MLIVMVLSFVIMGVSCDKGDDKATLDCTKFKAAVIDKDIAVLNSEIARLVDDLKPAPTVSDEIGHSKNIGILIQRINECDSVTAGLICYACIETLPAQTEIRVRVDSAGVLVYRIIDISTPEGAKLKFVNIHEASY